MELFALPPKTVIEDGILPYLQWRDLRSLCLVSKEGLALVQTYLSNRPDVTPEIRLEMAYRRHAHNLGIFLEKGIPCSKIYLSSLDRANNEETFSRSVAIDQLHRLHGSMLTSFRVSKLSIGSDFKNERRFWEGFTNLKELHAEQIQFCSDFKTGEIVSSAPSTFTKLQTLKIEKIRENDYKGDVAKCMGELLTFCTLLEDLTLPFIPVEVQRQDNYPNDTCLNRFFNLLADVVYSDKLPNLQTINFRYVCFSQRYLGVDWITCNVGEVEAFLRLCQSSVAKNVKLLHVDGSWFRESPHVNLDFGLNLGASVVSMFCQYDRDLEFAEKMSMPLLEQLSVFSWIEPQQGVQPDVYWPRLKCLKIGASRTTFQKAKNLFQHFFENDPFPSLQEAYVSCFSIYRAKPKNFGWHQLVESCASLKKLTLNGWRGPEKSLVKLCRGMTGLEQLVLLEFDKEIEEIKFFVSKSGDPVLFNPKAYKTRDLLKKSSISTLLSKSLRSKKKTYVPGPLELITVVGLRALLKSGVAEYAQMLQDEDQTTMNITSFEYQMLAKMRHAAEQI